eukprot:m.1411039 g.1411039  ORF g.1411039 m.1411039 type:complete len:224 (+) comp25028_c0_seq4:4140-4811(+)
MRCRMPHTRKYFKLNPASVVPNNVPPCVTMPRHCVSHTWRTGHSEQQCMIHATPAPHHCATHAAGCNCLHHRCSPVDPVVLFLGNILLFLATVVCSEHTHGTLDHIGQSVRSELEQQQRYIQRFNIHTWKRTTPFQRHTVRRNSFYVCGRGKLRIQNCFVEGVNSITQIKMSPLARIHTNSFPARTTTLRSRLYFPGYFTNVSAMPTPMINKKNGMTKSATAI